MVLPTELPVDLRRCLPVVEQWADRVQADRALSEID